ncbi:MAG TPA: hypothetical protein VFC07_04980 [Verrucomicrobiae bacterium]|nr:hypothetical protein [Verrucomicrobiae bacterium]
MFLIVFKSLPQPLGHWMSKWKNRREYVFNAKAEMMQALRDIVFNWRGIDLCCNHWLQWNEPRIRRNTEDNTPFFADFRGGRFSDCSGHYIDVFGGLLRNDQTTSLAGERN